MKQRKSGLTARILYILWFGFWAFSFYVAFDFSELQTIQTNKELQANIFGWVKYLGKGFAFIFGFLVLQSFIIESDTWRKLFVHGKGGSARWGGFACLFKHNMFFQNKAPIYLGWSLHKHDPWPWLQKISIDDQNHMVTTAMSRSGKSTTVIWPNLVEYPYPDSTFILDPKGEHSIMTGNARAKQGQKVITLDPFNLTAGKVSRWNFNPLDEIDINSTRAKEDIAEIADACIISNGKPDATSQHFEELQRSIISGLIAHIMSTQPKKTHNLPAVYDYFIEMGQGGSSFKNLMAAMKNNKAAGNLPQEAALSYENAGEKERGSIFTSTMASLKWIASDAMREHLSPPRHDYTIAERLQNKISLNTFKLSELKDGLTSIYVVLDFDAMIPEKQGRYMRILVNLALLKAHKTPMPAERLNKGRRTLFLLDEVAQLGYMKSIDKAFKTHAGSNIKLWVFFQNYSSMKDAYASYQDMFANSSKQFFGCADVATASAIEGYLGSYRERRGGNKSLLDSGEIMDTLGQQKDLQIIITSNNDKMELRRTRYIPNPNNPPEPKKVNEFFSELINRPLLVFYKAVGVLSSLVFPLAILGVISIIIDSDVRENMMANEFNNLIYFIFIIGVGWKVFLWSSKKQDELENPNKAAEKNEALIKLKNGALDPEPLSKAEKTDPHIFIYYTKWFEYRDQLCAGDKDAIYGMENTNVTLSHLRSDFNEKLKKTTVKTPEKPAYKAPEKTNAAPKTADESRSNGYSEYLNNLRENQQAQTTALKSNLKTQKEKPKPYKKPLSARQRMEQGQAAYKNHLKETIKPIAPEIKEAPKEMTAINIDGISKQSPEVIKARSRWMLPKDCTERQVKLRYPDMLDKAEAEELGKVDFEYNILIKTAEN